MAHPADLKFDSYPMDGLVKNPRFWVSWLAWFLKQCWIVVVLSSLGMVSYLLITHFVFQSVQVDGQSMSPTLENFGNYWLNRLAYIRSEPQQCDIVALKDPRDNTLLVKRIIAMPGQSVYLNHGKVYVDSRLLSEPYLPDKTPTYAYEKNESEFFIVGKDKFFVMGDNRNNSTDSRTFGAVPRQNILGKVVE
jgi:signal peptidase I